MESGAGTPGSAVTSTRRRGATRRVPLVVCAVIGTILCVSPVPSPAQDAPSQASAARRDSIARLRAELGPIVGSLQSGAVTALPAPTRRRAIASAESLARLAVRAGDDSTAVKTLTLLASLYHMEGTRGGDDRAASASERALMIAEGAGMRDRLPSIADAHCSYRSGRAGRIGRDSTPAAQRACLARAAAFALAAADTTTLASVRLGIALSWAAEESAPLDSAIDALRSAEPLLVAAGDREGACMVVRSLAFRSSLRRLVDSARVAYRRAHACATTPAARLEAAHGIGWHHYLRGDLDSAVVWLGRAWRLARAAGTPDAWNTAAHYLTTLDERGATDSALAVAHAWMALAGRARNTESAAAARAHLIRLYARAGRVDTIAALERGLRWPSLGAWDHLATDEALVHLARDASRGAAPPDLEVGLRLAGIAPPRRGPEGLDQLPAGERATLRALADAIDSARARAFRFAYAGGRSRDASPPSGEPVDPATMDSLERGWREALQRGDVVAGRAWAMDALFHAIDAEDLERSRAWLVRGRAIFTPRQRADAEEEMGQLLRTVCTPETLHEAAALFERAALVRDQFLPGAGDDLDRVSVGEAAGEVTRHWVATLLDLGRPWAALAALDRSSARALRFARGEAGRVPTPDPDAHGRALARAAMRDGGALLAFAPLPGDSLAVFHVAADSQLRVERFASSHALLPSIAGGTRLLIELEGAGDLRDTRGLVPEADDAVLASLPRRRSEEALREASATLLPVLLRRRLQADSGLLTALLPGPLALLPIAALPVGDDGTALGERRPVRLVPSLALLDDAPTPRALRGQVAGAAGRALVVGDPSPLPLPAPVPRGGAPRDSGARGDAARAFAPLPSARREAAEVAALLQVNPLIGSAARESAVRARLADADVVHFAAHAVAFAAAGRSTDSFIALAPDTRADGRLSVAEILGDPTLHLRASLVVVSACESGIGELRWTEGTLGLQRALLARGARTTLVSLWRVRDDATRVLMTAFYRHWLRDADSPAPAEALQRAQADVRRVPGFEHPYYWAGFQVIGQ